MKPQQEKIEHNGVDCRPVRDLLASIGGKWTVLIITRLSNGPMRFNALKRDIDISQKMLAETLRELEKDGFVERTLTPVMPPRVDYELTPLGRDLLAPIAALGSWAVANQERVQEARMAFEQRQSQPDMRLMQGYYRV